MKFFNEDKDYFLSNFDSEEKKGENTVNNPEAGSSDTNDGNKTEGSFEFTGRENPAPSESTPSQERKPRGRHRFWWLWLVLFGLAAGAFYVRYFVPHTEESKLIGYVTNVEKRGIVCKTFEGEMISESQLTDTARIYQRDVNFSIPDDSLGRAVQAWQGTGKPVVLTVKKYYGTLPWRGATGVIVTDVKGK
ncbi:MAG: hypothetical protein NC039_03490 [Muribaculaceae bacterium]|nr:hypothetical protein [Muribaculaceae bacterium]